MTSVLYFSTESCGPCKLFWPIVQEVCTTTNTPLRKIDAKQSADLTAQYQITAVPTLIILKDDQPTFRSIGIMSKTKLIETLQKQ